MTSSLALPTLPCVHLCPNLPLFKRPLKHSHFLCCSVPSFGVSTVSLKKPSFNIPSTSTLIFIKRRSRQHMKLLCLGEPSVRFSWCWCFCCCVIILLLYLHLSMFFILLWFIHIFFSTSSLTLLLTIAGVFTRHFILYFQPSPPQSDSRHFHFSTIPSWRERYALEWACFTHRRFLPYAPSPTF